MQTGTILNPTQPLPQPVQEEIQRSFPNTPLSELSIRYYENVGDVGYEYFIQTVLPTCHNQATVRSVEPFISFIQLGEHLIVSGKGCLVYDTNNGDKCTEAGPFWVITAKQ
jgi:hypothetical protein